MELDSKLRCTILPEPSQGLAQADHHGPLVANGCQGAVGAEPAQGRHSNLVDAAEALAAARAFHALEQAVSHSQSSHALSNGHDQGTVDQHGCREISQCDRCEDHVAMHLRITSAPGRLVSLADEQPQLTGTTSAATWAVS